MSYPLVGASVSPDLHPASAQRRRTRCEPAERVNMNIKHVLSCMYKLTAHTAPDKTLQIHSEVGNYTPRNSTHSSSLIREHRHWELNPTIHSGLIQARYHSFLCRQTQHCSVLYDHKPSAAAQTASSIIYQ